jgi:hypothetical protein
VSSFRIPKLRDNMSRTDGNVAPVGLKNAQAIGRERRRLRRSSRDV